MEVRASYTQTSIKMIDALPADEAKRVVAAVRDETWRAVRSAGPLAFIDMRLHLEVDGALHEVMGRERYEEACAQLALDLMQRPLFAPVVRGRLLRGHPERLLERMPMAWKLIFRDVGRAEVTPTDDGLSLALRELPILVRHDEAFLHGVVGTLRGVGEACATRIDVETDETRRGLGTIVFQLRF